MGEWSDPLTVTICLRYGDANADMVTDVGDIVFLINYLYRNCPAPDPPEVGDCNLYDPDIGYRLDRAHR